MSPLLQVGLKNLHGRRALKPQILVLKLKSLTLLAQVDPDFALHEEWNHDAEDIVLSVS